jgi:hypothetical protein
MASVSQKPMDKRRSNIKISLTNKVQKRSTDDTNDNNNTPPDASRRTSCQRKKKKKKKKNQHQLQSPEKTWRSKNSTTLMAGRNLPPLVHTMEEQKNSIAHEGQEAPPPGKGGKEPPFPEYNKPEKNSLCETTSVTIVVLDSCMCLESKTNIYVLKER